MTVKDVLKLTALFLSKDGLFKYTDFGGATSTYSDEDAKDVDKMLKCLNLVVADIASDYIPLKYSEEVTVSGGTLQLASLTKTVSDVISIKTGLGSKMRFTLYPDYLEVPNGKYIVTYTFVPDNLQISSTLPKFYGRLDERVFAFGTAMEYSYLSTLYEDASQWEGRYKSSLLNAMRVKHECRLCTRRWE